MDRVFAKDAVWDASPGGEPPIVGRDAIFDRPRSSAWTFAMHYYASRQITLDGDTAHARWMLWEPCAATEGNRALWMSAVSPQDYVRTPEGWRLQDLAVIYEPLRRHCWKRSTSGSAVLLSSKQLPR